MIYAHFNTFVIFQLEVGNLNELVYSRLDRAEERIGFLKDKTEEISRQRDISQSGKCTKRPQRNREKSETY